MERAPIGSSQASCDEHYETRGGQRLEAILTDAFWMHDLAPVIGFVTGHSGLTYSVVTLLALAERWWSAGWRQLPAYRLHQPYYKLVQASNPGGRLGDRLVATAGWYGLVLLGRAPSIKPGISKRPEP